MPEAISKKVFEEFDGLDRQADKQAAP